MKKMFILALAAVLTGCATVPGSKEVVKLEFRTGSPSPGPGLTEMTVPGSDKPVYLSGDVVLSNAHFQSARVISRKIGPQIEIKFTKAGAAQFASVTTKNIGKSLGILIDGQLISAPMIMETISGGRATIAGDFTKEEAERIAKGIAPK